MTKLVNAASSEMSNLTVGSSPGRGMRLNLPIAIVPLRRTDSWITSHRPHIWETSEMLRILDRGHSGHSVPHGHRIDFCEDTVFTNFAIKAIYAMWNNNWIQLLLRIA